MRSMIFAVALTILTTLEASGQVPRNINYQGVLTDANGVPVDGNKSIAFRIYNVATGGTPLYSQGPNNVPVKSGVFNVVLGPIQLPFDVPYFLETIVEGSTLIPRAALGSAPYGIRAARADSAGHADHAGSADHSVKSDTSKHADHAGNSDHSAKSDTSKHSDHAGNSDHSNNSDRSNRAGRSDTTDLALGLGNNTVTSATIVDGTIQMTDIGSNGATTGQVIKWSGTAWVPSIDEGSSGGGGFLPLTGGTMSGPITNAGNPPISMGKGNFGTGNFNTGQEAFVAGSNNRARGAYSVVGGGGGATTSDSNSAIGDYTTVGGGKNNNAVLLDATVGGGSGNVAFNSDATVGGGTKNLASGRGATVSGGGQNQAQGDFAVVGGGGGLTLSLRNVASASNSTVGGGLNNLASGPSAAVSGGRDNAASGPESVVGGGDGNVASGVRATIPGGQMNAARGQSSFAAGDQAKANHSSSIVIAGASNTSNDSTASGGAGQMVLRANGGMYVTNHGEAAAPYDTSKLINTSAGAYLTTTGNLVSPGFIQSTGIGFKFPDGTTQTTAAAGSNSGWTDDGLNVRLSTGTDKVGIGTLSPSKKLEVIGTAKVSDTLFANVIASTGNINVAGTFGVTSNATVSGTLAIGGGTPIVKILSASATLDFPATTAGTSSLLTISVTGVAIGDVVSIGIPFASLGNNTAYAAWISAANTVTVRFQNSSSANIDPGAGVFRVAVMKF